MAAGAQMGSSCLCSISQIDEIFYKKKRANQFQKCALDLRIQWNGSNKPTIKYKNLFGVKKHFWIHPAVSRYLIGALILIRGLCKYPYSWGTMSAEMKKIGFDAPFPKLKVMKKAQQNCDVITKVWDKWPSILPCTLSVFVLCQPEGIMMRT